MFADDVRRHFIGVVKEYDNSCIRIIGYTWVYHQKQAIFTRKPEKRERVLIIGDRLIINILPKDLDISSVTYNTENANKMFLTDRKKFSLDLSEFISI